MSIHVNVGYPPAPNGKEWKHLRRTCPELVAREQAGYRVKSDIPNTDRKYGEETRLHKRERCPVCFVASIRVFPAHPRPVWLVEAQELERSKAPGTHWVYEVICRTDSAVQVGEAKNLFSRLSERWAASCRGRWGDDCIPWLYDLLEEGRADQVELAAHRFPTKEAALAAEKRIRAQRKREGWREVTGLV